MVSKIIKISAIFVLWFSSCGESKSVDYRVIPLPNRIEMVDEGSFCVTKQTIIKCDSHNEEMFLNAEFLSKYLQYSPKITMPIYSLDGEKGDMNSIRLELDSTIVHKDGYTISVREDSVVIRGESHAGVFYAIQTLRKAISSSSSYCLELPSVDIVDYPEFGYRGVMLDVSRTFYSTEYIKKFIDLMALHNLNVFHWHLTDDQGWRVEVDKYPRLTQLAGGEFYTKEQMAAIVEYAADRHIMVIPEIDLPGHVESGLAAYPEFGCTGGPYAISSRSGVRADVLCIGNSGAIDFAKDVLLEVMAIFPSKYIHIGGDEVPRVRWESCAKCQRLIKDKGLKASAGFAPEDELQRYFNIEIEKFVNANGRSIIGWDEIVDGGLSENATVMSWRGIKGGVKAAKLGHDVIMSPTHSLYFDYYQSVNTDSEPKAIGGYVSMEKVYNTDLTIADQLTEGEQKHILGAQANIWTSWMPTINSLEYMFLPRMAALSEMVWMDPAERDFADFTMRMPRMLSIYDQMECSYAPHLFNVEAELNPNVATQSVDIELSSIDGAVIYYTLNGEVPTTQSEVYSKPVPISESSNFCARAILPTGVWSDTFKKEIEFNLATYKPLILITKPDARYSGVGLNDGLQGYPVFGIGNYWTGYFGQKMEVVIDLLESKSISKVVVSTLSDPSSHIMDSKGVEVEVSTDGINYQNVASIDVIYGDDYPMDKRVLHHELVFEKVDAHYVRVIAQEWDSVAGVSALHPEAKAFLFVGEIAIN